MVRSEAARAGWSRVIIQALDPAANAGLPRIIQQAGGTAGRVLPIIHGRVALVPNGALIGLANNSLVRHVALDRPAFGVLERTSATVGAAAVRQELGYDGAGIGVAVIDSGVTPWHDDLAGPGGPQRVRHFVDFVNGRQSPYDDFGHGTHVAGIVAGNGSASGGLRMGIAPGAHLVVLKTLDREGIGRISDVIAALDYVVATKDQFNTRVVNLSVSSGVYESYYKDPLTLAAKRVVEAGLVVIAAAGNGGRDSQGRTLYRGITAPGNAPWVTTVGASNHQGTVDRLDDAIAWFSSRGPTAVDQTAKPDLVAPGVGIESLSDASSALYVSRAEYLLDGTVPAPSRPYLSLSGTSMSAPVVTGTVALMLQANPELTPNAVKAILQYTAHPHSSSDRLTTGAGLLNAKGAVDLASFFKRPGAPYPSSAGWIGQVIWGNQLLRGGRIMPNATAWALDVTWGVPLTPAGRNVDWGEIYRNDTWKPWQAICLDFTCSAVEWGA
ncbi:MAG: S8 family peptidase, partial [Geodermatophilaceae bacterium]|nr:S8 family peptidase [Geodermatophilaceae bacterium]